MLLGDNFYADNANGNFPRTKDSFYSDQGIFAGEYQESSTTAILFDETYRADLDATNDTRWCTEANLAAGMAGSACLSENVKGGGWWNGYTPNVEINYADYEAPWSYFSSSVAKAARLLDAGSFASLRVRRHPHHSPHHHEPRADSTETDRVALACAGCGPVLHVGVGRPRLRAEQCGRRLHLQAVLPRALRGGLPRALRGRGVPDAAAQEGTAPVGRGVARARAARRLRHLGLPDRVPEGAAGGAQGGHRGADPRARPGQQLGPDQPRLDAVDRDEGFGLRTGARRRPPATPAPCHPGSTSTATTPLPLVLASP
jgi:hypothetical protein